MWCNLNCNKAFIFTFLSGGGTFPTRITLLTLSPPEQNLVVAPQFQYPIQIIVGFTACQSFK